MNSEDIKKLEDAYTANTYARYDIAIAEGRGVRAKDPEGREYLDFTSGIGVNSLGFCEPGWVAAVREQAGAVQHVSNLFYSEPCARAAEKLITLTGMSTVFFSNSGAEANEGAIKAARKYSYMKYGRGAGDGFDRYRIVTLAGSFHGRTMATITATGQDSFHKYFTPFLQGFDYAETNDVASLHETVTDKTCAIMVEFVQGEGGVNELDPGFADEIAKLCKSRDILLIADEVQSGVGRTGRFMAYGHFDVKPDIVTVAKGLGGGLPVGGVIFGEKTKGALGPGDHGSTFGGNPVVCAGADYVLSKFMDGGAFLRDIAEKGDYFREKLALLSGVKGISGFGLMIGADVGSKDAKAIASAAAARGLLILTAKDKIRLLPPLTIVRPDIDEGLAILGEAILAV
ncbi:MAG: acetylornithine/succinylornithine family transaminase [Clostridiales Family XIII bacterium]|jgi:acetylornithine/N-succinyldiaminopimelate aminotransferase|nr:acetylornithine/succinylornithine family transaminase [Clostridiales Family XIII bacterium]